VSDSDNDLLDLSNQLILFDFYNSRTPVILNENCFSDFHPGLLGLFLLKNACYASQSSQHGHQHSGRNRLGN
jgi:hypothetical protein